MTYLPHLQSLTPGNCLFNFLHLCLIFFIVLLIYVFYILFFYYYFYFIFYFYLFFIYLFFHFLHHLNLIKCFKPENFKSICNKIKSFQCIWFCTLLLHFGTRTYLYSPDEGSCYVFSTRNICCEFLASYGVFRSDVGGKIKISFVMLKVGDSLDFKILTHI